MNQFVSRVIRSDTIAAIATALSDSGIGIIRVSGEMAILIVDKIFCNKNGRNTLQEQKSHTIRYGYIIDPYRETDSQDWRQVIVDEVMISVMKAPNSYTREDTVEINCHGGVVVMQKILNLVLKSGAKLAKPGEFTKRAFLNGRIDLARAEAVMDVIQSQSEFALKASVDQLKGRLSDEVKRLRADILFEIAYIESALDDPEHISLEGYEERLTEKIAALLADVNHLINTSEDGKKAREGINTCIVGKPNAGKSSILNRILGEDRAIVTSVAGTTRDVLQETVFMDSVNFNLIDTAGIRDTEDVVEKIGVEKAREYAMKADLILYVVDASVPLDEDDRKIMSFIHDKKVIILLNKSDLEAEVSEEVIKSEIGEFDENNFKIVRTSAKENTGITEFQNTLKEIFFQGFLKMNNELLITNARHKEALTEARDSLMQVKKSLEDHMPEDFYSIDLMSAYDSLGQIIGEEVGEDLINEIFSRFCMGK